VTKKYLVFDEKAGAEKWLEIRTRLVAGTHLAKIYSIGEDQALAASDGQPRIFAGPTPDYAILEADFWLRDEYEVKVQDTLDARE